MNGVIEIGVDAKIVPTYSFEVKNKKVRILATFDTSNFQGNKKPDRREMERRNKNKNG